MSEPMLIDSREINAEHLSYESPSSIRDMILNIPTIDPETLPIVKELRAKLAEREPKHGHWIPMDSDGIDQIYRCSACGRIVLTHTYDSGMISEYPYCHCGAKMDMEV